jgi:hypothetical protein
MRLPAGIGAAPAPGGRGWELRALPSFTRVAAQCLPHPPPLSLSSCSFPRKGLRPALARVPLGAMCEAATAPSAARLGLAGPGRDAAAVPPSHP